MTHQERCKHGCKTLCDLPSCPHADVDALGPICVRCGKVEWPSPFALIIAGSIIYFIFQMVRWAQVGFLVVK